MNDMTDVIFRVSREDATDIYALFPGNAGTVGRPDFCQSYQHLGQHAAADVRLCIASSRPAKPEEYASLKAELEQRGYLLNIVHRATGRHFVELVKQLTVQ